MDKDSSQDAIATGRRIYLGNLLYTVKPSTIEEVLVEGGFENFQDIHISIDPISARNPGYCFVDFPDKATADRALDTLNVSIGGRPLKVGPCEPKKPRTARWGRDESSSASSSPSFNRRSDWNSPKAETAESPRRGNATTGSSSNHFEDVVQSEGRRLYVGGLGDSIDQDGNRAEIEALFEGFTPAVIGKRITPHESTRAKPGNHHYCFIDFNTKEEAEEARVLLDGRSHDGGRLRVKIAGVLPDKQRSNRSDNFRQDRGQDRGVNEGESPRQNRTSEPSRGFASRDWRRKQD